MDYIKSAEAFKKLAVAHLSTDSHLVKYVSAASNMNNDQGVLIIFPPDFHTSLEVFNSLKGLGIEPNQINAPISEYHNKDYDGLDEKESLEDIRLQLIDGVQLRDKVKLGHNDKPIQLVLDAKAIKILVEAGVRSPVLQAIGEGLGFKAPVSHVERAKSQ
jgi:hypothetical protein